MKRILAMLALAAISSNALGAATLQRPVQNNDTTVHKMGPTSDYETSKDPKNGQVVYKGYFYYADMKKEPTFAWLQKGIDEYQPDSATINYLKAYTGSYDMLVFMGTWCEDSQNLIPKLYKVCDRMNAGIEQKLVIGMDREKTTRTDNAISQAARYKVTLLPTIILINSKGEEAGRITETVKKSVEGDLADIIWKDMSK